MKNALDRAHDDKERHVRSKRLNVDQEKLDRAIAVLGVRSESEAIDRALDLVLFRDEVIVGIGRLAGTGGVENYFDPSLES